MTAFMRKNHEHALHEMLDDPIVRSVMTRDGVTRQDVLGTVAATRLRIAGVPKERCGARQRKLGPVAADR